MNNDELFDAVMALHPELKQKKTTSKNEDKTANVETNSENTYNFADLVGDTPEASASDWQDLRKFDPTPNYEADKKSKKQALEKGPMDLRINLFSSVTDESQEYYNVFQPSVRLPMNSPYLGLELVIDDFDPDDLPEDYKNTLKEAIEKINELECENKKCVLVKNDVAHFHCDGCGSPYQLNFKNYHDIANRETSCKMCHQQLDYGEDFEKLWDKVETETKDLIEEQYERESVPVGPSEEELAEARYAEAERDAYNNFNGTWVQGNFVSNNGTVVYGIKPQNNLDNSNSLDDGFDF